MVEYVLQVLVKRLDLFFLVMSTKNGIPAHHALLARLNHLECQSDNRQVKLSVHPGITKDTRSLLASQTLVDGALLVEVFRRV